MSEDDKCSEVEYFDPAATVAAVMFEEMDGLTHVLLTRREGEPFRDMWCFPGGHIDKFEQSDQAIDREVREETGLSFSGETFGSFDEIFPSLGIHNVVIAYAGRGTGELVAQETEVSEIKWVPLSKALEMDLAFTHKKVLDAFIRWHIQTATPSHGEEN